MLEKCYNRRTISYIFEDLSECRHYQANYGGIICSLQRVENRIEVLPLNYYGHDKQALQECISDVKNTIESHVFKAVGNIKYILVLKAEKQLVNGFRYIKKITYAKS